MNELKFFKGSIENFGTLSKNNNYFYLVDKNGVLELYLGDKLIAKSSTPSELTSEVERLEKKIDEIEVGNVDLSNYYDKAQVDELLANVSVDLSNYYTKEEVDNIIYENITKVLNTPT